MSEQDQDILTLPIPIARGGINKDIEPTSLDGVFTPFMLNMMLEPRRVRKRLGYRQLGSNLPFKGIGSQLISYTDPRGTTHMIAVTTTHAYEYQGSTDMWLPITPSADLDDCNSGWTAGTSVTAAYDTTTGNRIRGTGALKLTLTAGRSDGDQLAYKDISSVDAHAYTHIGFWLKSSTALAANALEVVVSESNHVSGEKTGTYVESLSTVLAANTWTFVCLAKTLTDFDAVISCSIYANATLADELIIRLDDIRAYDEFGGSDDERVGYTIAHDLVEFTNNGGSALIITNGVNDLFYYEGQTNDTFQTLAHAYPSLGNCVDVEEFWNHLMLINFNEGNQNVRSIAWANIGDIDDWSAGTSGLTYLTDSRGKLMRFVKLGLNAIVYSERSITLCRYHGGSIIFLFPTIIYRAGLYAKNTIIALTNIHQFLGIDQKIYEYAGATQLKVIGKQIQASMFSEMDSSKKAHIVAGYDEVGDRSYFAFPRAQDTYAQAAYCLNCRQEEQPWEYFEFDDDVRAFEMHQNTFAWYCDDTQFVGIYCDETSFSCNSAFTSTGYPMLITLSSDGYVYVHDEALGKDDAADIECEYQTQDITIDKEENYGRWQWLTIPAMSSIAGGTASVFYSSDEGVTWIELDDSPITLTSAWQVFRLPFDHVSRKIRFRFHQKSSSDLQIRDDMHCSFVLEPARD